MCACKEAKVAHAAATGVPRVKSKSSKNFYERRLLLYKSPCAPVLVLSGVVVSSR